MRPRKAREAPPSFRPGARARSQVGERRPGEPATSLGEGLEEGHERSACAGAEVEDRRGGRGREDLDERREQNPAEARVPAGEVEDLAVCLADEPRHPGALGKLCRSTVHGEVVRPWRFGP